MTGNGATDRLVVAASVAAKPNFAVPLVPVCTPVPGFSDDLSLLTFSVMLELVGILL
jgi:hypothetical protein